ncbi:MAG TPA: ATP-binding protein [Acetivibrio thermocellus]|nr:ATP-binding protein [Acetivibrio thermocellus]
MQKKFNKVIIKVKDTGIGIPKNMQAAIFERYRQVKNGLTAEIEGSGIGLSIVKSFVALHNGVIKVRSKENKGSEFIISLPIQLCEENQWHDPNGQNSQSRIIEAINIEFSDIYSMTP